MRKLLILIAIPMVFTAACATTQAPSQENVATAAQPLQVENMTSKAQKGSLKGHGTVNYRMPGKAGDILEFHLKSDNPQLYVNIYSPGDTPGQSDAWFNGATSGATDGFLQLPLNGDYTFQVFQMRANADRDADAVFELVTDVYPKADGENVQFAKVNSPTPVPLMETADATEPKILVEGILIKGACSGEGDAALCAVKTADGQQGFVKASFLQDINLQPAAAAAPTGA